jgi:hypothetical protein
MGILSAISRLLGTGSAQKGGGYILGVMEGFSLSDFSALAYRVQGCPCQWPPGFCWQSGSCDRFYSVFKILF